jgi:hypothetical protein
MKFFNSLILAVLICSNSIAQTSVEIFGDKQIVLPSDCFFKVNENSSEFSCPSGTDTLRSISFHSPDFIETGFNNIISGVEGFNNESTDLGSNMYLQDPVTKTISGYTHYLTGLVVNNEPQYSYEICTDKSCLKVHSNSEYFIQSIISQLVEETLFTK